MWGRTCTKAIEYHIVSDRPIPSPQKKKQKQTNKQTKNYKKHTQTNTSYSMVQNGRWGVDHVAVHPGTKTTISRWSYSVTTQIRSHKRSGGNINNARIVDGVAIVMEIFLTNF